MQFRRIPPWPSVVGTRLKRLTLLSLILTIVTATSALAQDINNGRALYITPLVSGQFSCSNGQCHGPTPANKQNGIQNAADDPDRIALAISQVAQMAFLKTHVTGSQLADLAAYIGNPGGVAGSPTATVTPASLSFPSTVVGSGAPAQHFAINNTGTAALNVSGVSSNNTEFSLVSSCGTIAAGDSCSVSVGFTPAATGNRSGTITVSHNATGGVSVIAVSGTGSVAAIPGIQVTPSSLDFGAVAVGSFSGSLTVAINSTGTAPLVITAISDTSSIFPLLGGTCTIGAPIAPGTSCTIVLRFVPSAEGVQSRTFAISHNANAASVALNLTGTGTPAVGAPTTKTMVEYRYAPLNYYFVTSRDDDKTVLDKIADFQRTGLSFPVYATEAVGSKAISRFYFDKVAVNGTRGSHFYTLLDSDKAALTALNPNNTATPRLPVNEGVDSWAFLPIVSGPGGSCASGLTPVYRLFRGSARFPDDPNHRFTTSVATYDAFVALGWDGEGVNFCVPQP
jgi:mono/diheme cytochrome c family protein